MLEFQFKSWFHANGSVDDAAHLVAYLVKVKGGMGVVLSYKGSTNRKDWQANLDSGSEFFRDSPELPKSLKHARVEVHHGFKWHKTSLDLRMNMFMMEPVEKILRSWGVPERKLHRPFKDFLYSGTLAPLWRTTRQACVKSYKHVKLLRVCLHDKRRASFQPGAWKWCISIGHSLGGAMSAMAALDIAVDSGSSQADGVVFALIVRALR